MLVNSTTDQNPNPVIKIQIKVTQPCKRKTASVHFVAPWKTSDVVIWHPISLFYLAGSEHCGVPLYSYNDRTTCVSTCDERKSRDGWRDGWVVREMYAINALAPFCLAAGCNDQMRRLWHLQFATDAHAMSGEKAIKLGCELSFPAAACHLLVRVIINCLYLIWSMVNMQRSVTNISVNECDNSQLKESKAHCSQVAILVCRCTLIITLASRGNGVELMGNKKVKITLFSCYQTRPACSNKKILRTRCFFSQVGFYLHILYYFTGSSFSHMMLWCISV